MNYFFEWFVTRFCFGNHQGKGYYIVFNIFITSPIYFFCKFPFGKICSMMDRMKIIFHKELKAKNAETNKLFSQLSALLVLVMGNIKKELKKTAHRRLWIVLTK